MLASSMITHTPLIARDPWDRKGAVHLYRTDCGSASPQSTMSSKNEGIPQKRGIRTGNTRKVSTLTAEQLDRKRANDREAQRSIRQKTKHYMKQLEAQVQELQMQVAEMRPRCDRYEELIKRNASLEDEVNRSKHQLSILTGHSSTITNGDDQAGPHRTRWPVDEGLDSRPSSVAMTPPLHSTHFPVSSYSPPDVPRATSVMSAPMQSSHSNDWKHQYPSTQSPSLGNCSDIELSAPVDPYLIDSQIHQSSHVVPSSYHIPNPQLDFNNMVSSTQPPSNSSLSSIYPANQHRDQLPEYHFGQYLPPHGSAPNPMPTITAAHSTSTSYPPSYPTLAPIPSQRNSSYPPPWVMQT